MYHCSQQIFLMKILPKMDQLVKMPISQGTAESVKKFTKTRTQMSPIIWCTESNNQTIVIILIVNTRQWGAAEKSCRSSYKLHRFPANSNRRNLCITNCRRVLPGFSPSWNQVLCEVTVWMYCIFTESPKFSQRHSDSDEAHYLVRRVL